MGEAYIVRRGGGAALNFDVVCSPTQPTNNNKDTTIWVVSDMAMNGWSISPDEPSTWALASAAGEVVGFAGGITFTKKNAGRAAFSFAKEGTVIIPIMVSDNYDAAIMIENGSVEHSPNEWSYNGKSYYYTLPGYDGSLWDSANPRIPEIQGAGAAINFLIEKLEKGASAVGMVWITYALNAPASFNAFQKNELKVYPIRAKQYTGGSWVYRDALIQNDSGWRHLTAAELYDYGALYTDLLQYKTPDGATVEEEDSYLDLKTVAGSTSEVYAVFGPIRLDHIETLTLRCECYGSSANYNHIIALYTSPNPAIGYAGAAAIATTEWTATASKPDSGDLELSLDVSGLSGLHYIYAGTNTRGATWANQRKMRLYSVKTA